MYSYGLWLEGRYFYLHSLILQRDAEAYYWLVVYLISTSLHSESTNTQLLLCSWIFSRATIIFHSSSSKQCFLKNGQEDVVSIWQFRNSQLFPTRNSHLQLDVPRLAPVNYLLPYRDPIQDLDAIQNLLIIDRFCIYYHIGIVP